MPTTRPKSTQTQSTIIEAAGRVLIDEGYNGFTLRKVANEASISIGNLNYHYPTKTALIDELFDTITNRIINGFSEVADRAGDSPNKRFRAILEYWIDDLLSVETTVFFPEIWSLANHHGFARDAAKRSYGHALDILSSFVQDVNPALTAEKTEILAKYICASLEGLTVFVGHEKMWCDQHTQIKELAIENLVTLVQTA